MTDEQSSLFPTDGRSFARLRRALGRCRTGLAEMSMLAHVFWMILFGLVVTSTVAFGIWHLAGTPTISSLARDMTLLDLLRVALLVTGGVGGTVALVVAYRRQKFGERTERREDTKLFNERFATASEQLSSEHAAGRLAGVYAMAALADDWDAGRQMCVNVLCAYMRMPYDPPQPPPGVDDPGTRESAERLSEQRKDYVRAREEEQVRNALMNTIGERLRAAHARGRTWHWCNFDFSGAFIDHADFENAKFAGRTSFRGARFAKGTTSFFGASFNGVNVQDAVFDGADVTFKYARLEGIVDFSGARFLSGSVSFQDVRFDGTLFKFDGVDFSGGEVSFDGTGHYSGTAFLDGWVTFKRAKFTGTAMSFRRVFFNGGRMDLSDPADWSCPPQFDDFPEGPPDELRLPTGFTPSPE